MAEGITEQINALTTSIKDGSSGGVVLDPIVAGNYRAGIKNLRDTIEGPGKLNLDTFGQLPSAPYDAAPAELIAVYKKVAQAFNSRHRDFVAYLDAFDKTLDAAEARFMETDHR